MVDRIKKELRKFSKKEKDLVNSIVIAIHEKKLDKLHIKKLKGKKHIYRARKGRIRIIFRIDGGKVYIISIEKRNDKTYARIS
jgi:mRNA-degrading endonuclease RelE of RelBE toxin-antitoxin system